MTAAVISLKGPFYSELKKIPTDISLASVLSGKNTTVQVHITIEWQMCAKCVLVFHSNRKTCTHLLTCTCIDSEAELMFPGATPMVPWHHPVTQTTIASSTITISTAAQTASLGLVSSTTVLLSTLFTFIFTVNSPNSTCPLFALFPHLLLFLQATHYPLSAFLSHSPISYCLFNIISFFLLPRHLLLPIANLNIFYLTWMKTPYSMSNELNRSVCEWWID